MAPSSKNGKDPLNLTPEEAASMGVYLPGEPVPVAPDQRELPLHEQVAGELTEDDVAEAFTGEITPDSREEVEDTFADAQNEAEDHQ